MHMFFRFLFAYTTPNLDAKTIAQVQINIMTKYAYLPSNLISDKGTAFMSHVIKEVAGVLGITLKNATTKQAQTIGLLERSHASIKQVLKIETGEPRSLWQNYVRIAVLIYNISYFLIRQKLAMSQAEFLMAVLLKISWIKKEEFAHSKHSFPFYIFPKMFLIEWK